MNRIVATMDDLPELPFEKVLSYLSLDEVIKSRAVSRRWYTMVDGFRAKSLCYSERPSGFIFQKSRWVSGAYAQNFISCRRFESFFGVFGKSMLSCLKHLRLCDLRLNAESLPALTLLNSLGQLEELAIIRLNDEEDEGVLKIELELHLPSLNSIQLEDVFGIWHLTLDAPRLQKIQLKSARLSVELVHGESVKKLITDCFEQIAVKNLKNIEYLICHNRALRTLLRSVESWNSSIFDSTFLSGLQQLKEIYVEDFRDVSVLYEQKQRYGRVDLKIYLWGLLRDEPEQLTFELSILAMYWIGGNSLSHLVENPSRIADEIPFSTFLVYKAIELIPPESEISILNRLTNLRLIIVDEPVQDIERFLNLLKDLDKSVMLDFSGAQSPELFDRLPEYHAVQCLSFRGVVPDLKCLMRFKHLIELFLDHSINAKTVREVVESFEFISKFEFKYLNKLFQLKIRSSNRFEVSIGKEEEHPLPNLNAAIQFIVENTQQKKTTKKKKKTKRR